MGTVVAAQIVEEEGTSRDGDANASRESGSGEFSAGECREHGETMLEVHQALSTMHHAQQQGSM